MTVLGAPTARRPGGWALTGGAPAGCLSPPLNDADLDMDQ